MCCSMEAVERLHLDQQRRHSRVAVSSQHMIGELDGHKYGFFSAESISDSMPVQCPDDLAV